MFELTYIFSIIAFYVLFCLFVFDGRNSSNTGQLYNHIWFFVVLVVLCDFSLLYVIQPLFPYTYIAQATICSLKGMFSSSSCAPAGPHFTVPSVVIVVTWLYFSQRNMSRSDVHKVQVWLKISPMLASLFSILSHWLGWRQPQGWPWKPCVENGRAIDDKQSWGARPPWLLPNRSTLHCYLSHKWTLLRFESWHILGSLC